MEKLTVEQREALDELVWALRHCTNTGLLDKLDGHPDTVNNFCDMVTALADLQEP